MQIYTESWDLNTLSFKQQFLNPEDNKWTIWMEIDGKF